MKIYLLPVSFLLLALCTFCRVALPDSMVINPVTLVGEWHATEHHPERGKIDTVFVINADDPGGVRDLLGALRYVSIYIYI